VFSQFWRLEAEVRDQRGSMVGAGEGSLLGLQTAAFSLRLGERERERERGKRERERNQDLVSSYKD
jgi:hypothetical protein